MRPEDLDVALRPRSSWEAMELGTALLRRHAGAVWRPWLLATLPLFALCNAAAWMLGRLWLAALLMWWLKPLFDRIALYVLSRGVFGRAPGVAEALRAQWRFGTGAMPGYLLWRRFSPARSLLMPVDVLEGSAGAQRRARRRVVGGPAYAQAALLTWTCWLFELGLALGAVATVFWAIPAELLPDSLRSFWTMLRAGAPLPVQLGFNIALWLAATVIGPFYAAAGFGLYLNRRTETEAWDVELAFRRLRERLLAQAAAPLAAAMLLAGALLLPVPVRAQAQAADVETPATLEQAFGAPLADDARFRAAAARAYGDPLLSGKRTLVEWRPKSAKEPEPRHRPDLSGLAALLARLGEWALWIVAGVLLVVAIASAPRWLRWLRGSARSPRAPATAVQTVPVAMPEVLPDAVAAAARRLWQAGRPRDALALLYRASVASMAAQAQVELPPGATEAQCLRAARRLPLAAARELFARVVRVWQYAAYAGRLPAGDEFEALLDDSQAHWDWRG